MGMSTTDSTDEHGKNQWEIISQFICAYLRYQRL